MAGKSRQPSLEAPRQAGGPLNRQGIARRKGGSWPGMPEPQRETSKSNGTQKNGPNEG